jgi:NhaP-type Na+/H+ or K+/H+ antiporter
VDLEIPLEGEGFEEVVVFLFLPVLVFEAALGLSVRAFFRNLGPILMLAVVALLVSAALVGGALALVLGTPLTAALLFGALISPRSVAVVAVFRQLGVPERVLVLVEGESLLNDGVAIVLFTILLSAALGADASVGSGIVEFLLVFFGGAAIGAVLGLGAAVLIAWLDRNLAAALTVAVAYGSFVLADDVLGFSGSWPGSRRASSSPDSPRAGRRRRSGRCSRRCGRRSGTSPTRCCSCSSAWPSSRGSSPSISGPSRWPSSSSSSRGPRRSCR